LAKIHADEVILPC